MPKRAIDYIMRLFEYLKVKGYKNQISNTELIKTIRLLIGNDSRVIQKYVEFMLTFGFITPASTNVYDLHWDKYDEMVGY